MKFPASIIAKTLGGTVEGNPEIEVSSFAKIEEARPGDLTFLSNPKYTHFIYTTEASVVLVHKDFVPEQPLKATLVRVDDPYASLAVLLDMVAKALRPVPSGIEQPSFVASGVELPEGVYVGAFAYIGEGVRLGKNVKIYPQAYIGHGCTIGDDTVIYPGVKIYPGCKIGQRCVLHSGVVIGADGFGFAPDALGVYHKIQQIGIAELGDDVELGANTTVDRATMGRTYIDHGVKLDNLIQIAHNVEVGHDTVMAAQVGVAGSTKIGANCVIGGQTGFAGHIHVGDRTTIGAQSGIPNNVAPDSRLMGYPAVPAGEFARNTVYIKRLGNLFDSVAQLRKDLDNLSK
ncbi:MAG: UDP-3-O-(3-hydroxymyristoyl)glucosamine N-acyltransferase [Muribaculaceae bacterium]|nr:UDP-3-O-(3-hydroxymyristoyl)glucosamine N-acyltransferase [Muribaculaceae bacterium]